MARRKARWSGPADGYAGVLGYLSGDAQAAVFRYLPHLEACVDEEVVRFGKQLGCDLKAQVQRESELARERLETARKIIKEFAPFAEEGQPGLVDLQRRIERVEGAAGAFAKMTSESAALLRRARTFAKHAAEFPVRRSPEGLRWAMEDLQKAHEGWRVVATRVDDAIARATEDLGERVVREKERDEIENLIGRLAGRVRSLEEATEARPLAEYDAALPPDEAAPPLDDPAAPLPDESALPPGHAAPPPHAAAPSPDGGDEDLGDDGTPNRLSTQAEMDPAGAAAEELADWIWELPTWLQEAQRGRAEMLALAESSLQEYVAQAVKDISKWRSNLERLQASVGEIETVADSLPERIKDALMAGIKAAKLDLRGSGSESSPGPSGGNT